MKARYFIIIAIIGLGYSGYQLTLDSQTASSLQGAIVAKDNAGSDSAPEQAQLTAFSVGHMLTGRSVFLEGSYNRAKAAAQQAGSSQANGNVYAQGQAACAGRADSITQAKCVTTYVSTHAQPAANPQPVVLPKQADFTKNFPSPTWTADATGVSLLVGSAGLILAAVLALR